MSRSRSCRSPIAYVTALAAALALAARAAHADWQYTHWGMSKDQVMLAANGALSPTGTRRAEAPYVGLRGHYETATHRFDAAMLFDAGDALTGVVLTQRTSAECRSTLGDLQSKYGSAQDLTTRRGPLKLMWNDAAAGNRVIYESAPAPEHGEIACRLVYEPIASSAADGL
ncbi:MAG TPA: hypothetical protein VGC30_07980 [Dokdonella sp.]